MYTQDDYKIPKIKKHVQIYLNDTNKYNQNFIFFLNEKSKYSNKNQSIEEFLNESSQFVPSIQIMPDNTEVFTILNKNEIYYILDNSLLREEEKGKSATLILNNGEKINVSVHKKKPKDQSRILDHLNSKEQFLEFAKGESIIYLNRNCISKIISID